MTASKKEIEERIIMDYFIKFYPDFPKGKLIKSESPDFIVKVNPKKTIGIELTQIDNKVESFKERIENTLDKKEDKLNLYKSKRFNAIWLLMHTDFINLTKSYNIKNKLAIWTFYSKFDKVFLFDLFDKKIIELTCN